MSRVGNKTINLPASVKISVKDLTVNFEGPKGKLTLTLPKGFSLKQEGSTLQLVRPNDTDEVKKIHGTNRALLANAVTGVSVGFKEELDLVGIGFRAAMKGANLEMSIGFSHPVVVTPLPGVKVTINENTKLTIEGVDKQAVGETAATIRMQRPPEPYQGKGIRYRGERIIRKEGKRAAAAAAPAGGAKK
ncbi:MAG: 50S ribosomal protein L6 [Bacilli bacterium]